MAKTKLTAMFDRASTGTNHLAIGLDVEIHKSLSRQMRKLIWQHTKEVKEGEPYAHFIHISGDPIVGNAVYHLAIPTGRNMVAPLEKDDYTRLVYEFKEQGSTVFINVTGNPSILAAGSNIVPILVAGMDLVDGACFQLLLPFNVLDHVLHANFWRGKGAKSLRPECVNLKQVQVAMYSGDLGESRDRLLRFLRAVYASVDATNSAAINAAKSLGLSTTIYDNHDGNMSITAFSARNRLFSITFYCKDDELDREDRANLAESTADGISQRIRFDITLYSQFLANNKIQTLAAFLERFASLVGDSNSDEAFSRWIYDVVMDRILLTSVLKLNRRQHYKMLDELMEDYQNDNSVAAELLRLWLIDRFNTLTAAEIAAEIGKSETAVKKAKKVLSDKFEAASSDIRLPYSFIEHIFYAGATSSVTKEERNRINRSYDGSNQSVIDWPSLHKRFAKERNGLMESVLDKSTGMMKISRVPAKKVFPDKLYVHQFIK